MGVMAWLPPLATLALVLGMAMRLEAAATAARSEPDLDRDVEPSVPVNIRLTYTKKQQHLRRVHSSVPPDQIPSAQWFQQRLDHFDPTDGRMWKQRWFQQMSFYKDGGPAFIFISGESVADPTWLVEGHTAEMAQYFGASYFQLEHRYYGQSNPFSNMSTPNLRWLTSNQALADLAYFIEYLKEQNLIKEGTKVVAFGGSYPGCLAAWVRLKYPHLIHASISSSGPLLAKADFYEYLEVVGRSLSRDAGQWCVDNIKKAFRRVKDLISSGSNGTQTVLSAFNACPLDLTVPIQLQNFYATLGSTFSSAVQYNAPDPDGGEDDINQYCSMMGSSGQNVTDDEAMANLAQVVLAASGGSSGQCLSYDYNSTIDVLRNVEYGTQYDAERLWYYQTCTEFGFFQTDDSSDNPFGEGLFPVSYYFQQCKDTFGESFFNGNEVNYGVGLTNQDYGGRDLDVKRVLFVNGDIDPWHALSRLTDLNSESPAILIEGTSHCYNMEPSSSTDSAKLIAARQKIQQILSDFLDDFPIVQQSNQ